jgi:hypothetical protein
MGGLRIWQQATSRVHGTEPVLSSIISQFYRVGNMTTRHALNGLLSVFCVIICGSHITSGHHTLH